MTTTSPASHLRSAPAGTARPALDELPPFRRADCPAEADQLLRLGLVRPLVADVLVAFDSPDTLAVRTAAAALLLPPSGRAGADCVVGFDSAAWLHAGPVDGRGPGDGEPLQVIVPPRRRRPVSPGLRGRQLALRPEQVQFLGPVPVTTPVRTAADVARDLPPARALAVLRRLGEVTGTRPHQVLRLLTDLRYARGSVTARQVVAAWADAP